MEEVYAFPRDAGCFDDGCECMELSHASGYIVVVPNGVGLLVDIRGAEEFVQLELGVFESVFGTIIDFGEYDNDGNAKAAAEVEMMLRHVRGRVATIDKNE